MVTPEPDVTHNALQFSFGAGRCLSGEVAVKQPRWSLRPPVSVLSQVSRGRLAGEQLPSFSQQTLTL